MKKHLKSFAVATVATIGAWHCFAADSVLVESRKADGLINAPLWQEVSGKWTASKNKSRISRTTSLSATNVSVCATNVPAPAFKVSPSGLEAGTTYKVEVTFSTTSSHVAAPDLKVAVSAIGLAASTIPTNTLAFQGSGADEWNVLGTITPATNSPTLTFTYLSGTLSKESRWYADAIRFTRQSSPQ
jgi:hypothetical protein